MDKVNLLGAADAEVLLRVPELPQSRRTWLDIAGIGSDEVRICRMLAYYLDPAENHGLGRLWLDALLALLPESETRQFFQEAGDFTVEREKTTSTQKRIDLMLTAHQGNSKAIITIEAKVWAEVYNDLNDYAKYSSGLSEKVALCLLTTTGKHKAPGWSNLTYNALATQVIENMNRLENLPTHQSDLLLGFREHLQSFTPDPNMIEAFRFYFEHHQAIARAKALNDKVNDWIFKAVRDLFTAYKWSVGQPREDIWCEVLLGNGALKLVFEKRVGNIERPYYLLEFWVKHSQDAEKNAAIDAFWEAGRKQRPSAILEKQTPYEDWRIRTQAGWMAFGYRRYEDLAPEAWHAFRQTLHRDFERDFLPWLQAVADHLGIPDLIREQ